MDNEQVKPSESGEQVKTSESGEQVKDIESGESGEGVKNESGDQVKPSESGESGEQVKESEAGEQVKTSESGEQAKDLRAQAFGLFHPSKQVLLDILITLNFNQSKMRLYITDDIDVLEDVYSAISEKKEWKDMFAFYIFHRFDFIRKTIIEALEIVEDDENIKEDAGKLREFFENNKNFEDKRTDDAFKIIRSCAGKRPELRQLWKSVVDAVRDMTILAQI
jgi:hypothetical protein